jgi:hypothetical protein
VSPRLGPRPAGVRYRVQVTEILPDGTHTDLGLDQTGDAYIVGVATMTGNRINAFTDHDGEQFLQERLVAYIANAVYPG